MNYSANTKDLLQLIPTTEFKALCDKWEVDKYVRKFKTRVQLQVLVWSTLFRLKSLREIEAVFSVPKSTFSDACKKRPSGFYTELCELV